MQLFSSLAWTYINSKLRCGSHQRWHKTDPCSRLPLPWGWGGYRTGLRLAAHFLLDCSVIVPLLTPTAPCTLLVCSVCRRCSLLLYLFFLHVKLLCVCKNTLWGDVLFHSWHPDVMFVISCLSASLLNYIGEGRQGLTPTVPQLERDQQEWPKQDWFNTLYQ